MVKQRVLNKLDEVWAAFKESYAGLSGARLTEPGVTGDWSVKDILAHVTTWEEEALKHLPVIMAGRHPPRYVSYGGIDGFNARMTERSAACRWPRYSGSWTRRMAASWSSSARPRGAARAGRASVVGSGSTRTATTRCMPGHTDVAGPPHFRRGLRRAGPYGTTIRYSVGDTTNSQGVSPP